MDDLDKIHYQIAISDIRWLKEQGWKAIYWIILLLAAISGLSFKLHYPLLFVGLSVGVSIMGVYYIYDLHKSAKQTRIRANKIHEYQDASKQSDKHHVRYLIIKIIIVFTTLFLTCMLILDKPNVPMSDLLSLSDKRSGKMDISSFLYSNTLGFIAFALYFYHIWRTTKAQMRQIRPEVVAHGCRICDLQIYTYFDQNNKMSEPACVYLSSDGSGDCKYDPGSRKSDREKEEAKRMLEINRSKCYLSLWGDKIK